MMIKKLSLLMAAVAVLAFAIPSMANASAVTFPAGTLLAKGSSLELTGTNVIFTSAILGPIPCKKFNLLWTLTKNEGGAVEGSGAEELPATEGCESQGLPVKTTNFHITSLVSTTSGTGTMSFTAKVDINTLTCSVTGTNVPFTYTAGGDALVFAKAAGIKGATCGTFTLDASFTVETKVSGVQKAVILD